MKSISTIAILLLAAATNVMAAQPPPGNGNGQLKKVSHRIATPLLGRNPFDQWTWVCRAVNVAEEPVTVTVRIFATDGVELDTADPVGPENPSGGSPCRSQELEPRHSCDRFASNQRGEVAAFCLITYAGPEGAVRGSIQVGFDGPIVAAE